MAGGKLETLREGYEASLRQMRTLLDAQARLREVAEQTAGETRDELERLAEALCPQLVDELRKGHPLGLSQVNAQDLADVVIRDAQRRLSRLGVAEVAGQSLEELYEQVTAELYIDGVASGLRFDRVLGGGGDLGSASFSGILSLNDGDVLDVRLNSDGTSISVTPVNAQFTVAMIH